MLELRIREARERLGWNQATLAERMSISQPSISAWESGKKAPRVKMMERLSRVLGVSFEWLSTGRGEIDQGRNKITESYTPELDGNERQLLACYSRLKPYQRKALLGFLESLL